MTSLPAAPPMDATPPRAVDYSDRYDPEQDFDHWYTRLTARRVLRHLRPSDHVLEAGSATGLLTAELCGEGRRILCLERSVSYAARARSRGLPGVTIIEGLIEDFIGEGPFDHVLALNVLHELPDAAAALARLLRGLRPGGLLHVTLPNPHSLHRLAAWKAGLIDDPCAISERGALFHTLRLEPPARSAAWICALGLEEVGREGILLKPLPNAGMAQLGPALIEAYDSLAEAMPDHAAMTYFRFRKPGHG